MHKNDNTNYRKKWQQCLEIIADNVSKEEFDTWFSPLYVSKYEGNYLYVSVPTQYYYEYIEAHYLEDFIRTIRRVYGENTLLRYEISLTAQDRVTLNSNNVVCVENTPIRVPVVISNPTKDIQNPFIIPGLYNRNVKIDSHLKEEYSFDSFVEGDCNKFARSAAYAVAKNPGGTSFNPFLIYSNVGLGKTHLAHAIGIETKRIHPEKVVLYISADQFLRQYTKSIKDKSTNDFLQFYQTMIDVLIIDDIQYLEGRLGMQEVFFQIFNYLYTSGKQLIITADKSPSQMENIEERVLSRLKWGLNAQLQVPDIKTRIEIIKKKLESHGGMFMPEDVIEYLAYSVSSSIRELEGAIISLEAYATLTKKAITMDLAREIVDRFVKSNTREITIDYIQKIVSGYYNLTVEQILSKSRKSEIVLARHISMYLSRKLAKTTLTDIGKKCGGKDHATVLHACKSIENSCQTSGDFRKVIDEIEKKILA